MRQRTLHHYSRSHPTCQLHRRFSHERRPVRPDRLQSVPRLYAVAGRQLPDGRVVLCRRVRRSAILECLYDHRRFEGRSPYFYGNLRRRTGMRFEKTRRQQREVAAVRHHRR